MSELSLSGKLAAKVEKMSSQELDRFREILAVKLDLVIEEAAKEAKTEDNLKISSGKETA